MKHRTVGDLLPPEMQRSTGYQARFQSDEEASEGASCLDPRCEPALGGCREIAHEKAQARNIGSYEPWSIWPDGGQLTGEPTPELIAQVKKIAPGRDVVKKQRWGRVRIVPNMKPGTEFVAESSLERNFYLHMLLDRDVEELGGQPETLEFWVDDRRVRYTPDFWVSRKGVLFYIEVKPAHALAKRDISVKLEAAAKLLKARGIRFEIITDRRILEDIPLRNADLVYRYRRCPLEHDIIDRIATCLGAGRHVFKEIENALGGPNFRPYIMRSILAGHIGYAPRIPISEHSLIWWHRENRP